VPVNTEVGKEDFTAPQSNDQEGIMGVHGVSDRANPSEVNMNEEHARCDGTRADERRSSGNYQDESGLPDSKQKLGVDAGIKSEESDGSATGHKRCTSQEHVRERQQPIFDVTPGTSGNFSEFC